MTYFKVVFVSSKSLFLTLCGSVITLTLDAVNDIGGCMQQTKITSLQIEFDKID